MRKLLFLFAVILIPAFSFSQTILDKIANHAKELGLKRIYDAKFELQSKSMASVFTTLSPGDYKVFGLGGYSEVKDIDLFIYNKDTNALIAKENTKLDGISIVNFAIEKTTKVWIKIYNRKSAPELEYYDCYLLITKY